ncbi:MAG: transketolase C-terminal domain-containing protein [bacterium]|nr:transketolase C-terminal domain-containing protein [bacterium]
MRRDFIKQVLVEMEENKDIMFLTGDLGFNALEPIKEKFPDRFINVGIAESHMVGMAAGLALEGKKVIVYSIAAFATMRPYEQIRTGICYDNLDVKIVGTGGGFNYPNHGVTHHTIEDYAIMNVLPNMQVFAPGHSWEAREAAKVMLHFKGPAYIRLGKSPGRDYAQPSFRFAPGRGYVIKEGKDIVLISTGNVLDVAMEAGALLEKETGMSVSVISMPNLKPIDKELIIAKAKTAKGLFTIEEHSTIGGLGAIVSSILWQEGATPKKFHAFGFPDAFVTLVGDRDYLLRSVGLDAASITKKVLTVLGES